MNTIVRPATLLALQLLAFSIMADDLATVTGGVVEGTSESSVHVFKGIPFAAPPTGDRRWQAPQSVTSWEGVRKADTWGARCMQGEMFGGPLKSRESEMSEDCLYLNVWTPAENKDEKLPVLVVFHGGGFAAGSGSEPRTDGAWFARQGIVVVAPNYRLGLFGFLAHPGLTAESNGLGSGNYGMLDQVAALRWVHDNIAAFGGDPANVTINGESAGSMSVSALMASPLSKHLFHRAIGQSGAYFPSLTDDMKLKPLDVKEWEGVNFAASVGAASVSDLRAKSAHELLDAVMRAGGWGYSPGLDNYFLPRDVASVFSAGNQAGVPLLAGWTSSELGMSIALSQEKPTVESFTNELKKLFGDKYVEASSVYPTTDEEQLMQSAADLASDLFISFATWKWIETHLSTATVPVYRYRFDRVLPNDPASRFGALHASDIEYAFNTLWSKDAPWQAVDFEVANIMSTAFANFVKTGNPNGQGVPSWPRFEPDGQVLYFDETTTRGAEQHRSRYEFLDKFNRETTTD